MAGCRREEAVHNGWLVVLESGHVMRRLSTTFSNSGSLGIAITAKQLSKKKVMPCFSARFVIRSFAGALGMVGYEEVGCLKVTICDDGNGINKQELKGMY